MPFTIVPPNVEPPDATLTESSVGIGVLAGTLLAATVSLLLSFLRAQPDGAVDATMFVGISAAHWWPAGVAVIAVAVVSSCALRLLRD